MPARPADHDVLKHALDTLYDSFNGPEAALDPIQIVRRYPRVADREIVAFVAAGLAFGRVSSVMASIETVASVMGASPAEFVTHFDPKRDGAALKTFVHRWVRGRDVVHMLVVLRDMIRARWGRIINITSVVGVAGNPGQANYAASKAGIIGFTKSLALEVASRGITVNAIAPGFVLTEMTSGLTDEQKEFILGRIPLGRYAEAEEISPIVAFLAGDGAAYITGQTYNVDGGLVTA